MSSIRQTIGAPGGDNVGQLTVGASFPRTANGGLRQSTSKTQVRDDVAAGRPSSFEAQSTTAPPGAARLAPRAYGAGWAATSLRRAAAAVAADVRLTGGYARHVGWAAVGAGLGVAGLQAAAGGVAVAPTLAGGLAAALQFAVPGLFVVGAGLTALDRFTRNALADGSGRRPWLDAEKIRYLTAFYGLAVGLSLAPVLSATVALPLGASLAVGAILGAALVAHAAVLRDHWQPGADLAAMGLVAAMAGVAPFGWSFAAGTALGAAAGTAVAVAALVLGGLALHAYGVATDGRGAYTPYADAHVVDPAVVRAHRAVGHANHTVHAVPEELAAKITRIRDNLRFDDEGRAHTLGIPVILLDGPAGSGKTSLGYAIAEALDADLLHTSAATLGRAYLPNYDAAVVRASTLFGQAELRSLRTGRLQVVLVDHVTALLGRRVDFASGDGLAHVGALASLSYVLSIQNGRRNGVVLVLADENLLACRDALLAISPQTPIHVAPPTSPQLHDIFAGALDAMLPAFARDWQVAIDVTEMNAAAFADLPAQVAALADAGAVGRHAVGIVSRMRRDAEAALWHTPQLRYDAAGLRAMMAEAGTRAVAWYANILAQPAQFGATTPRLEAPLDPLETGSEMRRMLQQILENPLGAVMAAGSAELAIGFNAEQSVNYANINRSSTNTNSAILDRIALDAPSYAEYMGSTQRAWQRWHSAHDPLVGPAWRDVASWAGGSPRKVDGSLPPLSFEAGELIADPDGPSSALDRVLADQYRPLPHFADVTLLPYPLQPLPLAGSARPHMPHHGSPNPYEGMGPPLSYYARLRQRQDGQRRDTYRSEHVVVEANLRHIRAAS